MGRVMFGGGKVGMESPVAGLPLGSIAEGSIVKIVESNTPVDFYVAKHDYQSDLNGAGRTLLVRKDVHSNGVAFESYNDYANNLLDTWLNGTYLNTLDSEIRSAIGATTFRYTVGNGNTSLATLRRSAFLLSLTEFGLSSTVANVEGVALPIASVLRVAYLNGSATTQWTRSPVTDSSTATWGLNTSGAAAAYLRSASHGVRPVFTLPASSVFDENTLQFVEVA